MKSFIRRTLAQTLAVCALGTGLVSTAGLGLLPSSALALSPEEISQRLAVVPVFVVSIGDNLVSYPAAPNPDAAEGAADEAESADIMYVFLSQEEAEKYVTLTRTSEDLQALPPNAEVSVRRLDYLYNLARQSNDEGSDRKLRLFFVPEPAESQQAAALNSEFTRGVPLFFPQFGEGEIISVSRQDGERFFPMFFSRSDLEELLGELNERNSEARGAITVGVVPLEQILTQMQTGDDSDTIDKIRLLPDSDTINDLMPSR